MSIQKRNFELSKAPFNLKKEVALVALTYRTSYKSLATILGTTEDDIEYSFKYIDNLDEALECLNHETVNETKEAEEISFNKTKEYFIKRKNIFKKIKQVGDVKKEGLLELNLLLREINDYGIDVLMKKNYRELNEEECEKIARYRLKYYYSVREIERNFNIADTTINKIEEELAKKDPIYSDKLNILHYYYDNIRNKYGRQ